MVAGSFVLVLFVLWAGFLVHRAPRFPGSLTGGVLAVSGAVLMVVASLAYSAVKRFPALWGMHGKRVTMGNLLTWHVYAGALGAVLAILHTGHRFESNLGMALTASMLVVIFSGYFGRHLLERVSQDLREKRDLLSSLQASYNDAVAALASSPTPVAKASDRSRRRMLTHLLALTRSDGSITGPDALTRAVGLAEAIAEVEYSITSHDRLTRLTSAWLKLHITAAIAFYALLALHVWSGIHFGLRWFQ